MKNSQAAFVGVLIGIVAVELGIFTPVKWLASVLNVGEGAVAFLVVVTTVYGSLVALALLVAKLWREVKGGSIQA